MHPSDATLLALTHGELGTEDVAELRAHLAQCDMCAARGEETRRNDEEMGRLLGLIDHPLPRLEPPVAVTPPPRTRRAAIAAAIALFAAGVAAASVPGTPLNRWIRERIEPPRGEAPHPAPAPVPTAPAQAAGGIELPAPATLTVHFTAAQPGGVLTVTRGSRPVVSLRAFGGAVAYRVSDGRIVVDNSRPAERYALEIPARVSRLTVTAGELVIHRWDTTSAIRPAASDTVFLDRGSQ